MTSMSDQSESKNSMSEQTEQKGIMPGQAEPVDSSAEQPEPDGVSPDESEPEESAAEQSESEGNTTDQTEPEADAADESGSEESGADQPEPDGASPDESEPEESAADQPEPEGGAVTQSEPDADAADESGPEDSAAGQSESEESVTEEYASDAGEPDESEPEESSADQSESEGNTPDQTEPAADAADESGPEGSAAEQPESEESITEQSGSDNTKSAESRKDRQESEEGRSDKPKSEKNKSERKEPKGNRSDKTESKDRKPDKTESKKDRPDKAGSKKNRAGKTESKNGVSDKSKSKRRNVKIFLITVIVLALLAGAGSLIAYEKGVFKASNYEYLNYDKYVTVGKYKGLPYEKPDPEVTDQEVKDEIDVRVAAKETTEQEKTGTVKEEDTINISYVGKVDGKTFDGGSADNVDVEVGAGNMIEGFEESLVGKKIGSKAVLKLTFPDDYENTELAGKDVVFTVTINYRKKVITPEYGAGFVKKYTKYKTTKEYEESVKKDLLDEKTEEAMGEVKSELWGDIVGKSKVKSYPEKQLDYEVTSIRESYEQMASSYGMSFSDYLKQMDMTKKEYNSTTKKYGKLMVKQKMILYSIAKDEGIKLSDKEYKKELDKMLKSAGYTEETFEQQYGQTIEEYGEENEFRVSMLLDKVMDFIVKNAKAG